VQRIDWRTWFNFVYIIISYMDFHERKIIFSIFSLISLF
jgi:hypothetical protein